MTDTLDKQNTPEGGSNAPTCSVKFWLRREKYPNWYKGHNGYGAIWTSCAPESALAIPFDLLIPVMKSIPDKVTAEIAQNAAGHTTADNLTNNAPEK